MRARGEDSAKRRPQPRAALAAAGGRRDRRRACGRTVATLLDGGEASDRLIADQLGHARVSMTQDYYMGRESVASEVAGVLNLHDRHGYREGEMKEGQAV